MDFTLKTLATNPILPLTFDDSLSYYEQILAIYKYVQTVVKTVEGMINDITTDANQYTDEQIDILSNNINNQISDLIVAINAFEQSVNKEFNQLKDENTNFKDTINSEISGLKTYIDFAISENNNYLIEYLSNSFKNLNVINYFTGKEVTIQNMFDTLAQFHLASPITYSELKDKNINYTSFAALNMTYSELVNNGGSLIN